jgi:hypothetical protein
MSLSWISAFEKLKATPAPVELVAVRALRLVCPNWKPSVREKRESFPTIRKNASRCCAIAYLTTARDLVRPAIAAGCGSRKVRRC